MLLASFLPLFLLFSTSIALVVTLTGTNTASITSDGGDYPTGTGLTYATDGPTITISTNTTDYASTTVSSTSTGAGNFSESTVQISTGTSATATLLVGGQSATTTRVNGTATGNSTASSISTSAQPTNTQPCNGHPQFCQRKYSNITYVAAHNSPFITNGNAARNQELPVTTQLEDGIRMLQFQTHYINGTIYLCHTSCELLNAGTLESYLTTVTDWLRKHPYEVITILMGNSDFITPENYTAPVVNSGLIRYVYTAPTLPMPLEAWPTLSEMILTNQRAVIMLDYEANQTAVPWLLDEFSQMWETPFSPTERSFPCTPQRPPDRPREVREDRMYMANHNLNIDVALAGISLDLPATNLLNETNAVSGFGSVGDAMRNCTEDWNRPPNFLLVDFYNIGNFNGSVFQVAAEANGVGYNRASCCGTTESAAVHLPQNLFGLAVAVLVSAMCLS